MRLKSGRPESANVPSAICSPTTTPSNGARNVADGYEAFWNETVRSYATHLPMWRASIDALLQAEHNPALREQLSDGQRQGREGIAAGLLGIEEPAVTEEQARTIGAVQSALISGVLMQHLLDPDTAPTGAEVVAGLRALAKLTDPGDESAE